MIPPLKTSIYRGFHIAMFDDIPEYQRVGIFPKLPAAQSLGAKGQNPAEHPRSVSGTCCVQARLVTCLHASCFHYHSIYRHVPRLL